MEAWKLTLLIWACCILPSAAVCQSRAAADSLPGLSLKARSDSAFVDALIETGKSYLNSEPDTAAFYLRKALGLAAQIRYVYGEIRSRINLGYALNNLSQYDEALRTLEPVLEPCRSMKLKKELAAAYNNMANAWKVKGNNRMTIECYQQALEALEDPNYIPAFYLGIQNNIGAVFLDQRLYDKALAYGREGYRLSVQNEDMANAAFALQNIAIAFKNLRQADSAALYFERLIRSCESSGNTTLLATALSNAADLQYENNRFDEAGALYRRGLQAARSASDSMPAIYCLHGLSLLALQRRQWDSAWEYAQEAGVLARKLAAGSYILEIDLTLSDISLGRGDMKAYKLYREQYLARRDTFANRALVHALQELETSYQTRQKEEQIRALRQREEIQELRLRQSRSFTAGALGLAGLSAVIGFLAYRNQRNRKKIAEQSLDLQAQQLRELEKTRRLDAAAALLQGQEEERSRLAKELHDGLGGMLSGIKHLIAAAASGEEQVNTLGRAGDSMRTAIAELRRISRNLMPEALQRFGLQDALRDYCDTLSRSSNIALRYQAFGLENRMAPGAELMVFRIVQELLNNVVKHAQASEVLVQVLRDGDRVSVTVEDNGTGFDSRNIEQAPGVGWSSIRSRVAYLGGELDLHTAPGAGASVNIHFQLQPEKAA